MLEFKRKELKFKLDDVVYNLRFPSVDQTRNYAKDYAKAKDTFDCVMEFLSKLGLPKKISGGMEMDHLNQIIGALTAEKK